MEATRVMDFFFWRFGFSNCINTKTRSVGSKTKLNGGKVMT